MLKVNGIDFPLNGIGKNRPALEEFESTVASCKFEVKFDDEGAELFLFKRLTILSRESKGRYNGDVRGMSPQVVSEGILHHALTEDPQAFDSLSVFMKQAEPKKLTMKTGGFSTSRRKTTEFLKVENF
jgi:hypothetical protein